MRIAQISDLHFTHLTFNPFRLFSKRALGVFNWLLRRRNHFFEHQLTPLPQLFQELGVDLVLVGGDLSTTALKKEFEKASRFVSQINQPWFATSGNHDRYTRRSCRNKHFYQFFHHERKEVSEPVEFFTLKDHRIEAHKIGKGWRLILLDTSLATHFHSAEGLFSEKLEEYLREVLALIPKEESILILNHFPFFQNDEKRHNLRRGKELQKILEENPRIRLYLHGHTHRQTVADLQLSRLPIVLDSGSCAQGKKGSWNLIDLKPESCIISTYRWDHQWTKTRTEEFAWKR
jgi:3',5'-cyclic AMP phosphodiesterase CpdA